jgi:hypothetical protein
MKNILLSVLILFSIIIGIKVFTFSREPDKKVVESKSAMSKSYNITSPEMPEHLDFCGEAVPLDTFYVNEQLDRELLVNTYWHSSTLLLLKRANRWLPVIEPILKKNNIPDDFKYLALIESRLENITSPAGAKGYWQLMKKTAQQYGLEVNKEVDERYHVEKATEAACKYLKNAYDQFGSWTLAAASYNMGIGGLSNRLKQQKTNYYYDLLLNDETGRYIYRTLAIKLIMENPEEYGFNLHKEDLYPPLKYHTVTVDSTIGSWVDFAKNYGISYRVLKELNPWLRSRSLSNPYGRTYEIKLPDPALFHYRELQSQQK